MTLDPRLVSLFGIGGSNAYFPAVWFAEGDESHLTNKEKPQGGGKAVPKKSQRPAWVIPQKFAKPRPVRPVEEAEALLLCGVL